MTPETPTPRTDAIGESDSHKFDYDDVPIECYHRMSDFARQLERELAELRKNTSELIASLQTETDSVERELADKSESLAFQTQLNREVIEREKQTHAALAAEREQVAILRSDEKRLVAFAKTYRMNAEILSDKLASERELADRLADALENSVLWGYAKPAFDAWREARRA